MTAEVLPTPVEHSPLEDWAVRFAALAPAVEVAEEPYRTQLTVRVRDTADAVAAALGVPLPTAPCTFTSGGGVDVLWMGPDEFLVLAPPGSDLEERLEADAVVDVSGQRTTLRLDGPHAADVLAHGCAIDLHRLASPPGTCVQTLLARTGIVLLVRESGFDVLVRASFAAYLAAWLCDASVEYLRGPL